MSRESLRPPGIDAPSGRFQTGIRRLIVVVACCSLVTWAGRSLWEGQHPAIEAARGLRSSNPAAREAAARQLLTLGLDDPDRAIPPLVAALGDPETRVRIAVAESLGAVVSGAARKGSAGDSVRAGVEGLNGLLKDREPSVRIVAANVLPPIAGVPGAAGLIDVQAVVDAIAATLGDPDEEVRLAALHAMTGCGPLASSDPPAALVAAIQDRSARNRAAAIEALSRFPCSLDPWLPALLRGVEDDPEVRLACQSAFNRSRPPAFSAAAIPALVAALGSPSRIVRSHAAQALYPHAKDRRAAVAIPALLALLREPIDPERLRSTGPTQQIVWRGWDPCIQAAQLLGQLAPGTNSAGRAIAALTDVLRSSEAGRLAAEDAGRRAAAARALGDFGAAAEPAVPALIGILRGEREGRSPLLYSLEVGPAAWALGRIAPGTKSAEQAVAILIEMLDERERIRPAAPLAAIEALVAFGTEAARALPRLRRLGDDRDPRIKEAAVKAVTAIEDTTARTRDEDGASDDAVGRGPAGSVPGR